MPFSLARILILSHTSCAFHLTEQFLHFLLLRPHLRDRFSHLLNPRILVIKSRCLFAELLRTIPIADLQTLLYFCAKMLHLAIKFPTNQILVDL
jgi:hypothetical protein